MWGLFIEAFARYVRQNAITRDIWAFLRVRQLPPATAAYFLPAEYSASRLLRFPAKPSAGGGYFSISAWDICAKTQLLELFARFGASVIFRILLPDRRRCGQSPHASPHETMHVGGGIY